MPIGAGMASLAHILLDEGYCVGGCDYLNFVNTEIDLLSRGIKIDLFEENKFLQSDIIVIGHSFISKSLIELLNEHKKVYFEYNDFLSQYFDQQKLISICGSHGKTTMVKLLSTLNKSTSYLCGDGSGKKINDDFFIFLESCEYKKHFLSYHPKEIIITNIDYDHVDFYKNEREYVESFQEFINQTGKVYLPYSLHESLNHQNIVTYGLDDRAKYYLTYTLINDHYQINFYKDKQQIVDFSYQITHPNFLELLCGSLAFYYENNFDIKILIDNLNGFKMPFQRFNIQKFKDTIIINDYCHHPSQIKYNNEQCKLFYKNKKYIAIFKLDRCSRLLYFKNQFINELEKYDYAYVLPMSNTENNYSHSSKELETDKIKYINSIDEIKLSINPSELVFSLMSSKDLSKENEVLKRMINRM